MPTIHHYITVFRSACALTDSLLLVWQEPVRLASFLAPKPVDKLTMHGATQLPCLRLHQFLFPLPCADAAAGG